MTRAFKVNISAPSIIKDGGTSTEYLMADGSVKTGSTTASMNYAQTLGTKQTAISSSGVTIVSVNITTGGNPVQVTVTGDAENNTAGGWIKLQLYRDSTAIGKIIHVESSAASENIPYALNVIDSPAAGTYTYSLKTASTAAAGNFNFGETDGPVINAIELNTILPSVNLSLSGALTANSIIKSGGTSAQYLMADGSVTTGGGTTTNALTIGTGLSGTSFNGSSAVTIANTGVLSINGSTGVVTGIATSGANSNITSLSGLTTALSIGQGGTGSTTAMSAATALLPSQSSNSGKYLTNDGAGTLSWATVSGYNAPTLGSTSIASGSTVTNIAGLTINSTTIPSSKTLVVTTDIGSTVQAYDADLAAIAGLASGTGLLKNTAGTWSLDTSTYLTTGTASSTYLPLTGGTISSDLTVTGNFTVNGTTTNLNSINLVIEDKNIIIADVATPTNTTADGAGITVKGATDKTFNWVNSTSAFTSSEPIIANSFIPTSSTVPSIGIYLSSANTLAFSTASSYRGQFSSYGGLLINTALQQIGSGNRETQLAVVIGNASRAGAVIRGAAAQTSSLQEWQSNTGTVLSKIDSSGNLTATSIIKSGGTSSQYLMADGSTLSTTSLDTLDIIPLDDISNEINGQNSRFLPKYQGQKITINNPLRLLVTINGIIQTVGFTDNTWQSFLPKDGFVVDYDGYIAFSEVPPLGSSFHGRLMAGSDTTSRSTAYPFRASDILLGE